MPRRLPPAVRADEAVADYFKSLPRLAKSTIESKRRTLRVLVKHLPHGPRTTCRRITAESFDAALRDLEQGGSDSENDYRLRHRQGKRSGRSRQSLQGDKATLRQFARHLVRRGWIAANFDPLYEITQGRKDVDNVEVTSLRQKRRIPFDQWATLLDACEHPRDRLLVAALLCWGRRASDMAVMRWEHVTDGGVQLFNVKLGRLIADGNPMPLAPMMVDEIARYLAWFEPRYGKPDPSWPLLPAKLAGDRVENMLDRVGWPLDVQRPMRSPDITTSVRRALKAAFGWSDDIMLGQGAHTLRRSHAREVKRRGGLAAAQLSMSHATPGQTDVYSGRDDEFEALSGVQRSFVAAPQPAPDPAPEPVVTPEPTREKKLAEVVDLFTRRKVA